MTLDELHKTKWWRRWLRRYHKEPSDYVLSQILPEPPTVTISYEPDMEPFHRWIIRVKVGGCVLDGYDKEKHAIMACEQMGWKRWCGHMTRDELKRTRWWALWVEVTGQEPDDEEAIPYALTPGLRVRIERDETWEIWAVFDEFVYLMACVPTLKEAVALCREMGWKITK